MVPFKFSSSERFLIAEYYLNLYQEAKCVVTNRLHTALPCLALGTPVLLITGTVIDPERFDGLKELTNNLTELEFINNPNLYDINNPPVNNNEYRSLKKQLEHICSKFTGYMSKNPSFQFHEFAPFATTTAWNEVIWFKQENERIIKQQVDELRVANYKINELQGQIKSFRDSMIIGPAIKISNYLARIKPRK